MADKVIINVRERPLSTDINNLQAMQSRMFATFLRYLAAFRELPVLADGATGTHPKNWTLGLDVVPENGGASFKINPGMLAQYNVSHPDDPEPLEDELRIGYLREALTVANPGGANDTVLVEARVIDVVTDSETRDVLDPVTGNFVATLVDKQQERQIEFQTTIGTLTSFPAFSGSSWVPICMFPTNASSLWVGPTSALPCPFVDYRNDLKDLFAGDVFKDSTVAAAVNDRIDASVESYAISAGSGTGRNFYGNFNGRVGPHRAFFRAGGNDTIDSGYAPVEAYTPVANTIEHLYLVPAISNGIEVMPTIVHGGNSGSEKSGAVHRGILVVSDTAPIPGGPLASADISLSGTPWAAFGDVPASRCLHVATYYMDTTATPHWFTQDKAGVYRGRFGEDGIIGTLRQYEGASMVSGAASVHFDFRNIVPPNARHIHVSIQGVSTTNLSVTISPYLYGGDYEDDAICLTSMEIPSGPEIGHPLNIRVPALFDPDSNDDQRLSVLIIPDSTEALSAYVACVVTGWSY